MVRFAVVLHVLSFVIMVVAGVMMIPWLVSLAVGDGADGSFIHAISL